MNDESRTDFSPSLGEGGRRPTEPREGEKKVKKFFAKHKTEIVLRLLRGEPLELVSRETGVTAATLSQWKEAFLDAGVQAFAKKSPEQEAQTQRLNAKIGELSMENELLYEKIARMEEKSPFVFRRSKK